MNRIVLTYLIFYSSFIEIISGNYSLRMLVLAISAVTLAILNFRVFSTRKLYVVFLWFIGLSIAVIKGHNIFDTAFFLFWPINFALLFSKDFGNISQRTIRLLAVLSVFAFVAVELNLVVENRQLSMPNLNANGLSYACLSLFSFHYFFLVSDATNHLGNKIINWLAATIYFLIIIKMGSRMAVLVIVFLLLIYFYKKLQLSGNFLFKVWSITTVFLVSLWFASISEIGKEFMAERFFLGKDNISILEDKSLLERFNMYQMLLDDLGIWIWSMKDYRPYPHNLFVELIMRLGLLGVFAVLVVIKSFRKAFISLKGPNPRLLPIFFVVATIQAMSSLSLEMNRAFFLGLAFVYNRRL